MKRVAAVAGIGQTRFAKNMGRGELDLATEAIRSACADAGASRRARSTASSATTSSRSPRSSSSRRSGSRSCASWRARPRAGVAPRRCSGWPRWPWRAAPPSAWSRSGPATARRRPPTATTRTRAAGRGRRPGARLRDFRQWQHPFGVASPAQEMALIARRHMHVYGTRRRALRHAGRRAAVPREPQPRRDHARRRSRSTTGPRRARSRSRSACSTARSRTTARSRCS